MKRIPILVRCPIIKRTPVIHRVAIFKRMPCFTEVDWIKCKLCKQFEDCSGNSFATFDSKESNKVVRVIQVSEDFSDWENLEQKIWELSKQNMIVRLVTDRNLPKEIIWAASYSDKNMIQINLDMMKLDSEISWVDEIMSIANRCGLYCVLCLHPIVPGVVHTYQVLEVINRIMRKGCFHVNLKFCEILGKPVETDDWINFNGNAVPKKYLVKTQYGWKCSLEYKNKFLEKILLFTCLRKISLDICCKTSNCTGLKN